ncbi:MAG: hypothetical protein IKO03_03915 [Lachnospiraceae bacterium]|jgi:hypothetical protein|nr:hypothetical protein [Lachnospiraceae bacterium]MBQ9488494.1 hypothetical protein [Lachnospiraceae bacterium]MBR3507923.1 hypothetical protein [Lachnospiraceae bacterium]MBR4606859.1 hypothetical protein [Lachnospiraceae bacterium]MBR6151094.1 hypothetical protein [Lachnospiraceae bacterium]
MKKTVATICMVLFVLISSTSIVYASCPHPNANGGDHLYEGHKVTGGHFEDMGYHEHFIGIGEDGNPIIAYHCHVTNQYQHCVLVCYHCGAEKPNSAHVHLEAIIHHLGEY